MGLFKNAERADGTKPNRAFSFSRGKDGRQTAEEDAADAQAYAGMAQSVKEAYRSSGATILGAQAAMGSVEDAAMDSVSLFSPLTNPIKEGLLTAGMNKLGIPDMLSEWAASSPDSFENAKAGFGWASLLPAVHTARKLLPKAINAGTDNLATRLDGGDIYGKNPDGTVHGSRPSDSGGFYGGDPLGGIAAGYSFEEHMRQLLSPQAIANKERRGFGQQRMDEYALSSQNRAPGNARASSHMHEAKNRGEKTGALIETMPAATDNIRTTVRAGDTEGLTKALTADLPEGHELPAHVADRFINKERDVLGQRQGKEKGAARLFQLGGDVPDPDRAIVKINDPEAAWSEMTRESAGTSIAGSSVGRALGNPNILKEAEVAFGKPQSAWKKDEWMDYYNSMAMFERGNWRGTKKGRAKLMAQPWFKKLPERLQKKALKLGGMDQDIQGIQDFIKGTNKTVPDPATVLKRYWKARAADNPKATQIEFIALIDKYKKAQGNQVDYTVDADGTEFIDYRTSWLSNEQALGGVGGRYSHDITNNNVYANATDGHDMMGADPVGGDQLWNMTPIQMYKPGESRKPANREQSTDPVFQQKMKDFEEKSGVPRNKGESAEAYQKRALGVDAAIKARHYAAPVKDAAVTGGMLSGFGVSEDDPNRTAGGLPVGLMNPEEQEKQAYLRTLTKPVVGNVSRENSKPFYS